MCYDCDEYYNDDGDIYFDGDFVYCDECGAPLDAWGWCTVCEYAPDPSPLDINEMLGAFDPDETQETKLIDVDETFLAKPFGDFEDGFSTHSDDYIPF